MIITPNCSNHEVHYCMCIKIAAHIEEDSINELKIILSKFGGWPVLVADDWNSNNFSWQESIYKSGELGYSISNFIDVSFEHDTIDSSKTLIDVSFFYRRQCSSCLIFFTLPMIFRLTESM